MNEGKLQQLSDNLEIQALKALCMEIIDYAPIDAVAARSRLSALLVEDAVADYGAAGVFEGREAVVQFLMDASSKPAWLWHALHSPRVEVNGDTATGYWTMNGQGKMTPDGEMVGSINRCRDDFRRTADGWKIATIRSIHEA